MPVESNAPRFPVRGLLAEFFRMERDARVPAAMLAELLGISDEQLTEILHVDGVGEDAGSVEWGDAATYLFDTWPRTRIFDALDAPLLERIPAGVRPAPIQW